MYEVAGATNYWSAWINGILQSSTTNNTYGINASPTLGYVNGNYFAGDMAEVLIFNRTLTASERLTVNNYLDLKYGLVTVPATPTNLVATTVSTNQISLTWSFNLGTSVTSFEIERATSSNGVYQVVATVASTLSYVDTNLTAGTAYYYEVAAMNAAGVSGNSNPAWAMTLSNGVSLPFGNLLLWLKADSGLVLENTNNSVKTWNDQSGNSNNANQGTLGQQPFNIANALNGLPVVRFNLTNNQFFSLPNVLNGTTGAEAFVVLRAAADVAPVASFRPLWHFGSNGNTLAYPNSSGNILDDFGSTSYYTLVNPAQPLDQYHVYEVAGTTNYWGAWINGVLQSSTTNNTYGINASPTLGCADGNYFSGDMAEVLIFNRTLNDGERVTVNNYLGLKYGLLPVPAAPTDLVAVGMSTNQISLTWNFNLGTSVTGFEIERATSSNGVYQVVATVVNTLSYVDTNLTAGTTYYYEVAAVNAAGMSGNSNPAWATTLSNGVSLPLGNLFLWLKADIGAVQQSTNNTVMTWLDQSGSGNNASQGTAANQPLYVTNVLNGFPVVRFNATNQDGFDLPAVLSNTTNSEAIVVLRTAVARPGVTRTMWNFGANGTGYPNTDGTIGDSFASTTVNNIGCPAQPLTQYHVYEVASQTGLWEAWINGQIQFATTNNTYYTTVSYGPSLGWFNQHGNYFDGDIAEVMMFNRMLTGNERQSVNNYLNLKYGLVTVPAVPTNLVATAISSNQISLTWGFNLGPSGMTFQVARATTSNGMYQVVGTVANALSYVDTNLAAGTTYYYEMAAVSAAGVSGNSNPAWATTLTNGASLPMGSLLLWLKADSGVLQQGASNRVMTWCDQSGNGNNANQTTATNQPLFVSNALNGMPVMRFSATNQDGFGLPAVLNNTASSEALVVLRTAVARPGVTRALWKFGVYGTGYPNTDGTIGDSFASSTVNNIGCPTQPLTQYHVYEVASAQNGLWAAWIDGELQYVTNNNTYFVNVPYGPSLGWDNQYGNYFDGDIAEVMMFNRTLAADERATVGQYLFMKYNLSQFAVDTIPPGNPTNLIATGVSLSQLNLQWTKTSTNETGFVIERKSGTNSAYSEIGTAAVGTDMFSDTAVFPTNQYFYRVKAVNYIGQSGYSAEASPPLVSLTLFSTNAYNLSGLPNLLVAQAVDADYSINQVEIATTSGSGMGNATTVPYSITWIPAFPATYSFTATATDTAGNSWISAPLLVTVYLDSNGDGIPDYVQVQQGNDPLNPWTPPIGGTNNTPPNIFLYIPTNATLLTP